MPLPNTSTMARPRAYGYGCRLGDTFYRLAVGPDRPLEITSAPLQAPQVSMAETPEDLRNDFGSYFSRTRFSGGEGLAFAHTREPAPEDSLRFFDSAHVDIRPGRPGELESFTLLPETRLVDASAASNLALAWDGTAQYMASGTTVRRCTDPAAAAGGAYNDDSPHVGEAATTVEDLVAVGTTVYAALGANGIHRRIGGAWAHWSDLAASRVWAAKATSTGGFVLAAKDNVLYEAKPGVGSIALVTLGPGETWVDLVDAGAAILASASNGYVYALGLNEGLTALELKGQTKVSDSARVQALGYGGGFVFYSLREPTGTGAVGSFWRAQLDPDSFTLVNASVRKQWDHQDSDDHSPDHAPHRIVTARDAVYLGVLGHGAAAGLWRYDLATAGMSRDLDTHSSAGVVTDVQALFDRLFVAVAGAGLYREETTYEVEGHLIGPLGDLFTASEKSWVGAYLDAEAVVDDTRIEFYATTDPAALLDADSPAWRRIVNLTTGTVPDEQSMRGVTGRYVAGMVKLYASPTRTARPAARGFVFRAYPGAGDTIIRMPISCGDQVEMPGRRPIRAKGLGRRVHASLKGIEGSNLDLYLLEPAEELYRGTVIEVGAPVTVLPQRGSPLVVCWVTFRGGIVSLSGGSQSPGAFNVGLLAEMFLGGHE
ncbi:MAG TPA: hypothetical protein VM938_10655 [Acidimicrobiales bacterium]|nr:hypothetical protein [Acidimicrobiales bacterium]